MFKRWKIDQDYRELCAVQFAGDGRVSEAASMLVLAQSGVVLTEEAIFSMADRLSQVADEHGLAPEDVQSALGFSEPQLRAGTLDF
jgi:hypothetical protein